MWMSDQLSMFEETTCEDTSNVISSPESVGGLTRSGLQDGKTIEKSGPDHAPVSHSAQQESRKAMRTSATYGRTGIGSSESASLQSSLVSRLMPRLEQAG